MEILKSVIEGNSKESFSCRNPIDKYNILIFLLLIIISSSNCSQDINEAWITGEIINLTYKTIQIGDNSVPVSENGEFSFNAKIKSPVFYEVSYNNIYWAIYAEPGRKIKLRLTSGDLSSLEYEGDLKFPNDYLQSAVLINNETNNFLSKNWVYIHCLNEQKFVSVIDSLKGLYLRPLTTLGKQNKDISRDFIRLFKADVDFGFNSLIIQYPERHLIYTGEKVILSQSGQDYINSTPYNDKELFYLSNYKRFCKSYIDYKADLVANDISEQRHYNLKKMDAVFQILPSLFHDKYLSDYWLSEYLYDFISLNGLTNSLNYIKDYKSVCKTTEFNNKINELIKTEEEKRKDHSVKVYKMIDGFTLEAHIFSPDNLSGNEKRPAIVLFHGGGWQGGNPSWMFGNARHFKNLGFVAVAAQYRLGNHKDITVFESLDDARDIIKWMRENSDSLHIVSDSIVAYGWSAGGHLAISAAIFKDSSKVNGVDSSPNATILFSPGISLPTNDSWIISALGYGADRSSINPVDHVRKGLPPTIILQGRDDTVTPLDGAQLFNDEMHKSGNYCELVIYDNVGHLFTPNTIPDYNDPQPDPDILRKATQKADEFLVKLKYIR
jgi:acetyl esterase